MRVNVLIQSFLGVLALAAVAGAQDTLGDFAPYEAEPQRELALQARLALRSVLFALPQTSAGNGGILATLSEGTVVAVLSAGRHSGFVKVLVPSPRGGALTGYLEESTKVGVSRTIPTQGAAAYFPPASLPADRPLVPRTPGAARPLVVESGITDDQGKLQEVLLFDTRSNTWIAVSPEVPLVVTAEDVMQVLFKAHLDPNDAGDGTLDEAPTGAPQRQGVWARDHDDLEPGYWVEFRAGETFAQGFVLKWAVRPVSMESSLNVLHDFYQAQPDGVLVAALRASTRSIANQGIVQSFGAFTRNVPGTSLVLQEDLQVLVRPYPRLSEEEFPLTLRAGEANALPIRFIGLRWVELMPAVGEPVYLLVPGLTASAPRSDPVPETELEQRLRRELSEMLNEPLGSTPYR